MLLFHSLLVEADNHGRWAYFIEFPVELKYLEYHDTFDIYMIDGNGYGIPRKIGLVHGSIILDEQAHFGKTDELQNYDSDMKEFKEKRLKKK